MSIQFNATLMLLLLHAHTGQSIQCHQSSCSFDASHVRALWKLYLRAFTLGLHILSDSFNISTKILNIAASSQVKGFLIFLRNQAKLPPILNGTVQRFKDGSELKMPEGVMEMGDKFRVRMEGVGTFGIAVRCQGIPVKIVYGNFSYTDPDGSVAEGYVSAKIRKMDLTYKLFVLPSSSCPLYIESIDVDSLQYIDIQTHSRKGLSSSSLEAYMRKLPEKWAKEIPESLKEHLKATAFGRGITACANHGLSSELTYLMQLGLELTDIMKSIGFKFIT